LIHDVTKLKLEGLPNKFPRCVEPDWIQCSDATLVFLPLVENISSPGTKLDDRLEDLYH
jgi:hypothetical protein